MNNVFKQCTKLTTLDWINMKKNISIEACYRVLFDKLCERFPQYVDDFVTIKRLYNETNQLENENVVIQIIAFLIKEGKL